MAHRSSHGLGVGELDERVISSPTSIPMPSVTLGHLAFSALQFVPVPMLVLDDLKTVVLVNEAMGTLLGVVPETATQPGPSSVFDLLRGQSLSQVGVDMLQDGRPVWIDWEQFFDSLVLEASAEKMRTAARRKDRNLQLEDGNVTPTIDNSNKKVTPQPPRKDAVVEVIITRKDINRTSFDSTVQSKTSAFQSRAKMLVTIFEVEGYQTYFSLTFTNTDSDTTQTKYPLSRKSIARTHLMEAAERQSFSGSNPSSAAASDISSPPLHSLALSPSAVSLSSSPFPPLGPPARNSINSAPSLLQKLIVMKDALIDDTEMPIFGMWKDGSVTYPNRAARRLLGQTSDLENVVDGLDLLPRFHVYNEDFTTQLDVSDYPISVLLRTETPFTGRRVGMHDVEGNKRVYDVLGELIRDDVTGEVLAGIVQCRDVTNMTQLISRIKEEDEERFRTICDAMPQLVWTTGADGYHDFYNSRWYEYTGLTEEESCGEGWMLAFHPEDLADSAVQWQRCLRTGEPYVTEYRCRSKDGEWRWFIGRALPLRSKETGQIEKWFGTCTDANEILESRHEAKRTRQQLLSVIAHAQVTVFQVDLQRRITMLEGALIEEAPAARERGPRWYIGQDVYKVFNTLSRKTNGRQKFLEPIETIITGRPTEDLQEHVIGKSLACRTAKVHVMVTNSRY
jgi:PAS domain S-box-containing protein